MKNQLIRSIISAGLAIILPGLLSTVTGQERNEEVTIIAPFQPRILDPSKPAFFPEYPEVEKEAVEYQYTLIDRKVSTSVDITPLEPRRPSGDPKKELYRNFLKAGFGTYLNPYLLFTANSLQSDKRSIGFRAEHMSSLRNIEGYDPSTFSNTGLEISANRYSKKSTVGASLSYDHNLVHRYGFQPDSLQELSLADGETRQVWQTIGLNFSVKSTPADRDKFRYLVTFKPYYLKDSHKSREAGFSGGAGLDFQGKIFSLGDSETISLPVSFSYLNTADSISSISNLLIGVHPSYEFKYEQYRLKVGLSAVYASDTSSKFHFYPFLLGRLSILENRLSVYAGIRGALKQNSFREHAADNPFIASVQDFRNTSENFELYGGLNAGAGIFSFMFEVNGLTFNDLPLYVTDTSTKFDNQFRIIYDDGKLVRITSAAEISVVKKFLVRLKGDFAFYDLDSEEKAWHRPGFGLLLEGKYFVASKVLLSGEIYYVGKRYAKNFLTDEGPVTLDPYPDLNVGAEYFITGRFTAFLSLRNLLNQQYQKWYNYPVQGFQAMGGVTFSF